MSDLTDALSTMISNANDASDEQIDDCRAVLDRHLSAGPVGPQLEEFYGGMKHYASAAIDVRGITGMAIVHALIEKIEAHKEQPDYPDDIPLVEARAYERGLKDGASLPPPTDLPG